MAQEQSRKFVRDLVNSAASMGFTLTMPTMHIALEDRKSVTYSTACKEVAVKYPEVILAITPKSTDIYNSIKKICCLLFPTPSQVVTETVINKFITKGEFLTISRENKFKTH